MTSPIRRRQRRSYPGLYRATVVNATDPLQQHRVQLTIPAVSSSPSSWAATVRDVAGRPQLGDEVLVGFEAGQPDFPYVVGVLSTSATTPVELSDDNGNTVRLSTSGIDIIASNEVRITAAKIHVSAGLGEVDSGMFKFSGVVQTDTLIAQSVIASSYSPGAGNIW